jgi:hypothetical protein
MASLKGKIDILLGSNIETGMFYSKGAFARAGITATSTTWFGRSSATRRICS